MVVAVVKLLGKHHQGVWGMGRCIENILKYTDWCVNALSLLLLTITL
jgi:hypothetical protein